MACLTWFGFTFDLETGLWYGDSKGPVKSRYGLFSIARVDSRGYRIAYPMHWRGVNFTYRYESINELDSYTRPLYPTWESTIRRGEKVISLGCSLFKS